VVNLAKKTPGTHMLVVRHRDRPGVLAEVAEVFGRNDVSIERVWQEGSGDEASLVFITHRAKEGAFQATLRELQGRNSVHAVESLLRVEGDE